MSNKIEWLQVGELSEGFAADANTLENVDDLAGRTLNLHMDNGWVISHHFESGDTLTWKIIEGEGVGKKATESYTATCLRDNIYFVDFIKANERATSVSLVLNLETGNATVALGQLPTEEEAMRAAYQRVQDKDLLTPVATTFLQCSIDRPYSEGSGHSTTEELIGKRVQYEYSPHEIYEHIYLNINHYTWHCLKGVEKGLTDTDLCHYYKIDTNLYFFVWREKIIPTIGVVMVDFDRLKTTGKIFGYDGTDFEKLNNFPVGAFAQVLNETKHSIS